MIDIHLKIKAYPYDIIRDIYSITARDKINSVMIYENDFIMDRILNDMNLWEIWRFLLNMFNFYSNDFTIVKSSEFYNGSVVNSFHFDSKPIAVSTHNIAISLPRKIRDKYFIRDFANPEKFIVNPDLYLEGFNSSKIWENDNNK